MADRDIVRAAAHEVKYAALELRRVSAEGLFEGYASVFERVDLGNDAIAPGAFRDSLAKRGAGGVRMLYQHDASQPIGAWTSLEEDARGLFASGRLELDVARAREVLALMRSGALDGLSIGFRALRARRDPRTGIRRIEAADLWEISVVTFPMQPEARVRAVKHAPFADRMPTEREFERWLTRDAGLSRSQARAVLRHGLDGLRTRRDAGAGETPHELALSRLRDAARLLRGD
jgi:HK97 family phage prohead protease